MVAECIILRLKCMKAFKNLISKHILKENLSEP